ncbi:MAG TPA: DUF2249 domain-containing protein [Edaphocola sp.]|nr:DUF2249 domain-containing protein [Edaphocola sp.]
MLINEKTRVSEVIRANKGSIDALAALARPLEKLRNPLLRKVMASRVTLSEAARMGGCSFEDMLKALRPLGFEMSDHSEQDISGAESAPEWLARLSEEQIMNFDVRALLAGGTDPLKEIMAKFKQVKENEALCIMVNFKPVPLINLLGKKNVLTYTRMLSPTLFETYFYKAPVDDSGVKKAEPASPGVKAGAIFKDSETAFKAVSEKFSPEKLRVIDVRALEMPGPMQTILGCLAALPERHALYVYHKRIPVYLLEDLADKAFEVHICQLSDTDVRMLLFKSF